MHLIISVNQTEMRQYKNCSKSLTLHTARAPDGCIFRACTLLEAWLIGLLGDVEILVEYFKAQ